MNRILYAAIYFWNCSIVPVGILLEKRRQRNSSRTPVGFPVTDFD
jgi:hypothetical protein